MRGFTSSQFYLDAILNQFDIFAVTEHWLFEEQLGKLEHLTNNYTGFGVASQNNPDILSGQRAHGGGGGGLKCSGKPVTLVYPPISQLAAIA